MNSDEVVILQDRYVTYRKGDNYRDVGPAYIQYVLHEYFTVKKFVYVKSHIICQSLEKPRMVIGRKKCKKNTIEMLQNTSMTTWQVMNRGFTCKSKQQSTVRVLKDERRCFRTRKTSKQLVTVFFGKTGHVRKVKLERFFDTWCGSSCLQNACFRDSWIRVSKMLRQVCSNVCKGV